MKKILKYGILTIILVSGLYLLLRFSFGIFTPFNYFTAQQSIKKEKIQIAELGELPLNVKEMQQLANKYGFNFHFFGCNVSADLSNGTKYYNQTMIKHLEKKYGIGWWKKFQAQLDSLDKVKVVD